jgi:RND family efflux transporter MFP subunit
MSRTRSHLIIVIVTVGLLLPMALSAQPVTPVRVTRAIDHEVRSNLRLTGTVESRRSSLVASEIAGIVTTLDAREGDLVQRGAPLARLRADNMELRLHSAQQELREAKARLDLTQTNLQRARGLYDDQLLSRQQLDDAVSESEAWLARSSRLEAEVSRLKNDLARAVVRAPFTGVVTSEKTSIGEWIAAGGGVVELIDLANLEVTVNVPESRYAGLQKGAPAQVRFPSLGGLELPATVRAVVPRANPQSRTFPVKIEFRNDGTSVGVGMIAEVRMATGTSTRGTVVPKDAIVRQGATTGVYVVGPDSVIEWIEVETGLSSGAWVEVDKVRPGARVVTRGNERLRNGQTVRAEELEYPKP